jgi:hypothetical protein
MIGELAIAAEFSLFLLPGLFIPVSWVIVSTGIDVIHLLIILLSLSFIQ